MTDAINALEMSDEDFMNTSMDSFAGDEPAVEETTTEETEDDSTDNVSEDDSQEDSVADENDTSDDEKEESTEDTDEEDKSNESEEESDEKEKQEQPDIVLDVQAQLDKLFKPFKANGKDISVKSVDEAIQLMQMGANYSKKMTALKPGLKVLRMLENNGLLDEEQVSFLIDINKKDPNAIAKLLKDSEINPLEVDLDKSVDYKTGNNIIDEAQLNVEEVLEQIKESPTYNRTVNLIGKEWDSTSRQTIVSHPEIIAELNSHMESGIYDKVQAELERRKLFGEFKGVSDLVAYKTVGDMLNAQGLFDDAPDQSISQKPEVKPKTNSEDPKIKAKKQAAAITKGKDTPSGKKEDDFNPLSLSDEEFEKRFGRL